MYNWRKLPPEGRSILLKERQAYRRPWHAPPHFEYEGTNDFLITAACFEHANIIGKSPDRMAECEAELLDICACEAAELHGWCILPNHYHLLTRSGEIRALLARLGKFHGSSSYRWNGEDRMRGRKVWYRCFERSMRSDRHFYASLNYVHHNPVKHGYVQKWQDWPYSSAVNFLEKVGSLRARAIWREFPVLDYGSEWDPD